MHSFGYRGLSGRQWHLYGDQVAAENVALLDHAKGLYFPPARGISSQTAWQVGSTPRKVVHDERILELLIGTRGRTTDEHDEVESDWWADWSLEEDGRLEVDDGARWIDVRLKEYPDDTWSIAPDVNNFMDHDMRIVSHNPAWQGGTRPIEKSGSGAIPIPITNPTDRPQWLNFVGTAGQWYLPDGLSSRMVPMPNLSQGWKLYTDPQVRTLEVDNGAALWPEIMKGVTFTKPIPPRTLQPVLIYPTISGSGTIRVEMVDQYSRPWG